MSFHDDHQAEITAESHGWLHVGFTDGHNHPGFNLHRSQAGSLAVGDVGIARFERNVFGASWVFRKDGVRYP